MKKNILIGIMAVYITGCSVLSNENSNITNTKEFDISNTEIQTETVIERPTHQETTQVINRTTMTMQPTDTKINIPTLDETKSRIELLGITNFNDCYNPCWWGIKLGTTKWNIINDLLTQLNIGTKPKRNISVFNNTNLYFAKRKDLYGSFPTAIAFYTDSDDIINIIIINTQIPYNQNTKENYYSFRNTWKFINVPDIINTYGEPTRIYYEDHYEGESLIYQLWMFFDKNGLAISYTAGGDPNSNNVCIDINNPKNYLPSLSIYIKSLNIDGSLEAIAGSSFPTGISTLKDFTGLEISEFIQMVKKINWNGCIQKNWKSPHSY
jgi:hypothetical protein